MNLSKSLKDSQFNNSGILITTPVYFKEGILKKKTRLFRTILVIMKCHFVNFHIRVVILYMNIWCYPGFPVANSTPAEATAVIPLNALSWSSESSSVKSPPGVRSIISPFLLSSNNVILLNFPNVLVLSLYLVR